MSAHRYALALTAAQTAAQAAAALVSTESGRPESDRDAELLIQAALTRACPTWGYLGRELGPTAGTDVEQHCWLVDPHEGPRGLRGRAVSIGLVRAGVPVLGVVLVYAPASGGPDSIAWAEGCGPIVRQGRAVTREQFASELDGEHTILVSQAVDRSEASSRANAVLCHPARARGLASFAHRLALVAVGEAELAVSLHGSRAWSCAAGHALLRAVGGELFDRSGQPVCYSRDGSIQVEPSFAGAPLLAPELAELDWSRVHAHAEPSEPHGEPSEPGLAILDAASFERALGCLFGQFAGDSLGSLVEFESARAIALAYPDGVRRLADGGAFDTIAGQPTDDSELALMLARSLVAERRFDDESIARGYAAWSSSEPFDMGVTTGNALHPAAEAVELGRSAVEAARAAAALRNLASQANGALMRVCPLGIFGWRMPASELAELARRDASITHPNPVCLDANALFVVAIAHAIATGCSPRELHEFALSWAERVGLHRDVVACVREAGEGPPTEYQAQMGWLRIALRNAFFQVVHASSLEAGIVDTVMRGGDTDTNAAIAGALLGAVHGCTAIPSQWRDRVVTCRPIAGLAGVDQPRPRVFWPVDVERLAEQLLLAAPGSKS